MHFLVGVVVIYLLWSHPVSRALLLIAFAALLCFTFLPAVAAWIITAVVTVGISVEARDELRARRQWLDDEALLRRAALTRARRTVLK
jgi:membrane protein YdbS with pleckstrin-like domain